MSRSRPMSYGWEFQQEILHLMLKDPIFCYQAGKQLNPSDFTQELSWFFVSITSYEGSCPSKGSLCADITKQDEKHQPRYYEILDQIYATTPDAKKINQEMSAFIKANLFIDACYQAVSLFNNNKHTEAYNLVGAQIQKVMNINFKDDGNVVLESWKSLVKDAKVNQGKAIPTGVHLIDQALSGGLMPGSWTTFLGASNAGKSMIFASIAKNAAQAGKNVFVTVHEDEEKPTLLRYLACISEVPYDRLQRGEITVSEGQRLDAAEALIKKHIRFRFMYGANSTIDNVEYQLRLLHQNWPVDLYVCDYGQCLRLTNSKIGEVRLVQEEIYQRLSQICLELNIAGAGGAQVNRAGNTKNSSGEWLKKEDVSDAFGIAKKASNIITINRSFSDNNSNRIVFVLDKNRNGPCPVAVECVSDFSKCSVYSAQSDQQWDRTKTLLDKMASDIKSPNKSKVKEV